MEKSEKKALQIQAAKIRKDILTAVFSAKSGHPGGSLSAADILTYLYFKEMNVDPSNPKMEDRDRLVLSKGHVTPALYSTLAEKGFFAVEELKKFRQPGSFLQGHPDMKGVPGVDMSTGSLGLGISAACGMAIAAKKAGKKYHIYAIIGDGESEEGQVWEAAMFAAHYKLDNLIVFLDCNGLQIDGSTNDVIGPMPFDKKFEAFNFNVITIDGHDFDQIEAAINKAKVSDNKPTVIIAKTIKGKGVSYMENNVSWHGSAPNEEQYNIGITELDAYLKELEG
ncbi:MAG: transketolase [Bacillota bacterium]|nr:transketolase [Bacillota bacterium]